MAGCYHQWFCWEDHGLLGACQQYFGTMGCPSFAKAAQLSGWLDGSATTITNTATYGPSTNPARGSDQGVGVFRCERDGVLYDVVDSFIHVKVLSETWPDEDPGWEYIAHEPLAVFDTSGELVQLTVDDWDSVCCDGVSTGRRVWGWQDRLVVNPLNGFLCERRKTYTREEIRELLDEEEGGQGCDQSGLGEMGAGSGLVALAGLARRRRRRSVG